MEIRIATPTKTVPLVTRIAVPAVCYRREKRRRDERKGEDKREVEEM